MSLSNPIAPWSPLRKISYRFLFIYLLLQINPISWLSFIPGGIYITQPMNQLIDWMVNTSNQYLFHVRPVLVPLNGSGDTSYAWAQLWLYLSISMIGCIVWSIIDYKRTSYYRSDYWLRTIVRYFIAMNALAYGIIKLFAMQMLFPSLSQLATPLGDYLPMRLSWMFIGYSTPYQVFSGVMEVIAGLLLFNRKTILLGLFFAAGVFSNVVMLNLSYDIPVKLFSMHLLLYSLFLLAYELPRLIPFFILNQPVPPSYHYQLSFSKKWLRYGRIGLKLCLFILFAIMPVLNYYEYYKQDKLKAEVKPIRSGIYDINRFVLNGDTIPVTVKDTITWKDVIFENGGSGSINTTDTLFRQRYGRGYFSFTSDTLKQKLSFTKRTVTGESIPLFESRYEVNGDTIRLWSKIKNDSLFVELQKKKRHFQLTERQFHWLSEYNR